MFGRYEFKSQCNDENDTESWSFPSNYERFSTVNVPKSRLGKRRNIDASSEVKRDVLKGLSAEPTDINKLDKEDTSKDSCTQNQFLTHPVNSSLTPSHRIGNLKNYNIQSKFNQEPNGDYKQNSGYLTPFRKETSQPLQEIKNLLNEQKVTPDLGKPPPSSRLAPDVIQVENTVSESRTVLNKSFEVTEVTTNEVVPYCVAGTIIESHGDSMHSDVGNNSSFMTAHDIYNAEKGRVPCDSLYIKTPRRGFSLLDMLASPVDPVSLENENETLKNILSKTPRINNFENFKTPFRLKARDKCINEMFTPSLKNHPQTHMFRDDCLKRISSDIESKSLESHLMENENIDESQESSLPESNTVFKKTPPSEDNKTLNEPPEMPIASPSLETKVKRRIFEGLGWSLPPSSFSPGMKLPIYQPKEKLKEISSVLLTPNNSLSDGSKFVNECIIDSTTEIDANSHSISTDMHPQSKLSSEDSAVAEVGSSDRILSNESFRESCNEFTVTQDPCKSNRPVLIEGSPNPFESDKEADTFKESITVCRNGLNKLLNVSNTKSSPSDTSFAKASEMQTNDGDNFPVTSMEISLSATSKDNDETDMVTVQNILCTEEKATKDVTVVARPPDNPNKNKVKEINPLPQVLSTSSDKAVRQLPQEQKCEKEHPFVVPSQPPAQSLILNCPRQVIKPQSNVVYINRKPYTVLSMLGRGGSSEVYQVLDAESSKLMAMKFVNLASVEESIATGYLNEIEVLTKLQGCPSVIRMFDSEYIPESKILYVVMEKGDTDFSRLMKDIMKTKKISMSMIIYYWTEMLSCVKDIHEKGIIHSDLKPANFLLVSGRLKLIDFGIASSLQGDMTSVLKDVTTGTFNYMSPEAIRNCGETRAYKINYKSDIWSLGCILYNLLYGRTPFSHLTNTWTKLGAIADPDQNVSFPTDSSTPPHLMFSVRWALRKDPKERPTASELLKLAELTPGPESKLGRQISTLLAEYISQTFPNCSVSLESESKTKDKQF